MRGGEFLWVGFEGDALDGALAARLRALDPHGLIFFTRNIAGRGGFEKFCADLRVLLPDALFAIDLEGGPVDRLRQLRGGPRPSAEALALLDSGGRRAAGRAIGEELRPFDIKVDFVPCVDLGPASPGTGLEQRLFGGDGETVARLAGEFLEGLNAAGVAGCLKHYPGLGGSAVDSHLALPVVEGDAGARAGHLLPYEKLGGRVPFVMVAHCRYPQLYRDERPATLNPEAYEFLRGPLAFAGVAISDDLHMQALSAHGAIPELAVKSLAAGADCVLICKELGAGEAAALAIEKAVSADPAFATSLAASRARLAAARAAVNAAR